jgi:hypothetical protein
MAGCLFAPLLINKRCEAVGRTEIELLMLRLGGFIPFAAPSTAAFAETNRQDSRFACIAPKGRGTGMCRVSSPKGRFRDEARCQRDRSPFWQPSANTRKGHKSEEHRMQAATGRPADSCHPGTRATRASHPNLLQADLSLVTFFWPRKDKFAWSEFGQL